MAEGPEPTELSPAERWQYRQRNRGRRNALLLGLCLLALIVGAFIAYPALYQKWSTREPLPATQIHTEQVATVHRSELFHYRIELPGHPWSIDDKTKASVKSNLFAMRRANPEAWFALTARHFAGKAVTEASLQDAVLERLRGYFHNLEWEAKAYQKLGNKPARCLAFQGEVNRQLFDGECCFLISEGIGYCFEWWTRAGNTNSVRPEIDAIRSTFQFLADQSKR